MRALQLTKFYWPFKGGIESAVRHMTEGLHDAGVEVEVLCSHTKRRTRRDEFEGYSVTRAGAWTRLLSTSMSPPMLLEMIRRRRSQDIVHVHMPDPMAALALFVARPTARIVVQWHSDVIRQKLSLKLYEPLQHWLLDRCDRIVATSEEYAEASHVLRRWRGKLHVMPLGVRDLQAQVDESRVEDLRRSWGARRAVLAVGRMTHYKGYDHLIRASRSLPEDVRVIIAGAGVNLERLRRLARDCGVTHRVELPGALTDDDLVTHLAACDVFCVPSTSRAESFGMAMIEAMSFGKPVVATNIEGSGVPWVNQSGKTGINVPVADAVALSDALRRLTEDDELAADYGRAARARYLDEFTVERMTLNLVSLYGEVLHASITTAQAGRPAPSSSGSPEQGKGHRATARHLATFQE